MKHILFAILVLSALPSAANAQAAAACSPFLQFPVTLNLGAAPSGLGGESIRCVNTKFQAAINALQGMRATANGIATLDGQGKLASSQMPASFAIPGRATIGGGLTVNAPSQDAFVKASYWTQNARALYTSDTNTPINWLGNGAGGGPNQYGYGGFAQGVFLSGLGDVGISAATRTDMITTPGRFPAAANFQAFNFKTANPITAWGIYGEARRKKGAGQIHGGEVNVTDLGDGSDRIVPSAMKSGPNAVYGAWSSGLNIACGGNVTKRTLPDGTVVQQQTGWDGTQEIGQAANCGVALPVYANGAKFEKGYILGENALVGCDGTGFPNVCNGVEFGRGTRVAWIDGSTRLGATIDSNVSPSGNGLRQMFTDGGVTFDAYGGTTFNIVAKNTDVNGIQALGGATAGAPARLVATGSPNAGLALSASGAGTVQVQSIFQLPPVLVASLPTCTTPLRGSMAIVSDAASPAYRQPLVGGGTSDLTLVLCGTSGWIVH
jgi:hypothetical protein